MSERCPLSNGSWSPNIPTPCIQQCEVLWEQADVRGEYEIYRNLEDIDPQEGCSHDGTNISYMEEGLQSIDATPLRVYTVVDQCTCCGEPFGEQKYQFNCPNN